MHLHFIRLLNYRNFGSLVLKPAEKVNVFIGRNGHGKTNFIESIHFLLRGESFRPATPQTLRRWTSLGDEVSLVTAQLTKQNLTYDLATAISAGGRNLLLNGKKASIHQIAAAFPVILFSPESLGVIKNGPDARRQFLDEVLASLAPENDRHMRDYGLILRQRNKLLREHKQARITTDELKRLLRAMQENFLTAASRLVMCRLDSLRLLQPDFAAAFRFITKAAHVDISVDYLISEQSVLGWSIDQVLDILRRRLHELQTQEIAAGGSLVGPHKHDIRIIVDQNDSRFYCSQGTQRALILAFKMARVVYHNRVHKFCPILLLDDVLSELDAERRSNLVSFVNTIPAQVFITTTELSPAIELRINAYQIFEVNTGQVQSSSSSQIEHHP